MPIYAVRVTSGQEINVALNIYNKCKKEGIELYSIVVIPESKGIIYLEGKDLEEISKACLGVQKIKGIIKFPKVEPEELKKFITEEPIKIDIKPGEIVGIISGPFKGEEAIVVKIDEEKSQITVKPISSFINFPVTLPLDKVRKKV